MNCIDHEGQFDVVTCFMRKRSLLQATWYLRLFQVDSYPYFNLNIILYVINWSNIRDKIKLLLLLLLLQFKWKIKSTPFLPFQWWKRWRVFGLAPVHHWFRGNCGYISYFILIKIVGCKGKGQSCHFCCLSLLSARLSNHLHPCVAHTLL